MRIKARRIYNTDQSVLVELRKEYTLYGGFLTRLEPGCLIILPRKEGDGNKKKSKKKGKRDRNKRTEKYSRS